MLKKILCVRKELESHRTRRSAFSGIGAEVIHWELTQRKIRKVPSISTISRILSRHGKTGRIKKKRNNNNQPYPYVQAERIGDLHQTDIVGPRHLKRFKRGYPILFLSYCGCGRAYSFRQPVSRQTDHLPLSASHQNMATSGDSQSISDG